MTGLSYGKANARVHALEQYFSQTLAVLSSSLIPNPQSPIPTLAVALSGGADSMACTLLAHAWATARGGHITALTVDHGLRPESRAEAEQVAGWMRARGIAHHILTPPLLPAIHNPQSQARTRRYSALLEYCRNAAIPYLLLGHHADDQAETVALQRHRGESPASRAGMAFVTTRGEAALVRPLLGTRKRALVNYLQAQQAEWVEDPSNARSDYARNRLRQALSEAEILALWHESQMQGAQRHADDIARNDWMQAHTRVTETTLWMDRMAWCACVVEPTRMDYLSHLIRHVGGKIHRPRFGETQRLAREIAQEPTGTATLGHCLIRWQGADCDVALEATHPAVLDAAARAPHMVGMQSPHNPLVKPPFWCFNMPHLSPLE